MSGAMGIRGDNPFSWRSVLALVVVGSALFLALLWMIGTGIERSQTNDGGGHGYGTGLNGYAGFADLLEAEGYRVVRGRKLGMAGRGGLLVLTPPLFAAASEIDELIANHRQAGPTLVILPKWASIPIPKALRGKAGAKDGWVWNVDAGSPEWANDLKTTDKLDARIEKQSGEWRGLGLAGRLPEPKHVQSILSGRIGALIEDREGQILAAYLDDGSASGRLLAAAGESREAEERAYYLYPVVIVSEPDLLNNWGMADRRRAMLALRLVDALREDDGTRMPVTFDLTLNGLAASDNLLTLAFTPPFLAATLCLVLAAFAVGWRAFLRFGPPRTQERAIAFGKLALVTNSAGLIRRSRRMHLLSGPYLERARTRLSRALGLPRGLDTGQADEAIDRALAARKADAGSFTATAARLEAARAPHDLLKAARDLHALERMLTR
jgi:hypothetical protein